MQKAKLNQNVDKVEPVDSISNTLKTLLASMDNKCDANGKI